MRAVADPNIIVSALLLSPGGSPAQVLLGWHQGEFELVVSPRLLDELERALAYGKLRKRIDREEAERVVEWLRESATLAPDPDEPPAVRSADPGDDHLLSLAARERAALVSGDKHLLDLRGDLPVFSAGEFLQLLEEEPGSEAAPP